MFEHFSGRGVGIIRFPTFGGTFLLKFGRFLGRGGAGAVGLPDKKKIEALFYFSLEKFQDERWVT